jgi:tetratricopeptide (TPR) repeat protein
VAELITEMDNIRAAWEWSVTHQQFIPLFRVSAILWYLFEQLSWFKEGESTFRKTADALLASLSGSEPDFNRVALNAMRTHRGYFLLRLSRSEEAYAHLAPSTAFLRTSGYPTAAANSLFCFGIICWGIGRYSEAEESLGECLKFARGSGERWYEALADEFLGRVAFDQGSYYQAREYLVEALAIMRQLGDPSMTAHLLTYLSSPGAESWAQFNSRTPMVAYDAWTNTVSSIVSVLPTISGRNAHCPLATPKGSQAESGSSGSYR